MKIAVVHFGRKGAGPVFALEMAKALAAQNHIIYYYASSNVENRKYVEKASFNTRFFDTYDSKLSYAISVIFPKKINNVISSIKKDNPDIVYSPMNDMWAPFLFPKLKDFIRIKTIHDVGIHEGNNSIINKWWNNTNFKNADKYVILSKKYIKTLNDKGICNENVAVIPHAGFNFYKNISQEKDVKTSRPLILFFGRIDQYKGLETLLQALPSIIEKHPNVILRIAGNGNLQHLMPIINQYRQNIDLQNRWIKDEEVSNLISDASLVVLPYTHATQSGVIPLAYAFSKPVVATNVGCLDEQIIDGETGFLIEPRNPQILSSKINMMLSDLAKTEQMGRNAHIYMKRYLTWEASANLLINLIKK